VTPRLVVLAAPSGAGKTTIARALVARRRDVGFSVSATTRSPRAGEQEGADYYFLSPAEFDRRIAAGAFLEWAEYAGQRYGTLRAEVDRIRRGGRNVLLDIEVQGAAQVRERYPPPESLAIFLLPPSGRELVNRLRGRGTEAHVALWRRLEQANQELQRVPAFDHVVVNDDLDAAVDEVSAAIDDRRPRQAPEDVRRRVTHLVRELEQALDDLKRTAGKGKA
jgi:guanylate kinase